MLSDACSCKALQLHKCLTNKRVTLKVRKERRVSANNYLKCILKGGGKVGSARGESL